MKSTAKDMGITLHEELDRREKLMTQLQSECDAIRGVLGILERPVPEALNLVTRVVGRKPRQAGRQAGRQAAPPQRRTIHDDRKRCKRCRKSATEGAEFGKHAAFTDGLDNHCKQCRHEIYAAKKNPPKPNGHNNDAPDPPADAEPSSTKGGLVCIERGCGITFENAKALGIHKSKIHYGESFAAKA